MADRSEEFTALMHRNFGGRFLPFDSQGVNPPAAGVRLTNASWCVCRYGLERGDVVVAIDGIQVTGVDQYNVLVEPFGSAPR